MPNRESPSYPSHTIRGCGILMKKALYISRHGEPILRTAVSLMRWLCMSSPSHVFDFCSICWKMAVLTTLNWHHGSTSKSRKEEIRWGKFRWIHESSCWYLAEGWVSFWVVNIHLVAHISTPSFVVSTCIIIMTRHKSAKCNMAQWWLVTHILLV